MDIELTIRKKAFGDHVVLKNTGFSLHGCGIVLVTGPNGAGKSTLFSMLSGNDLDYDGKLLVNGEKIDSKNNGEYQEYDVSYCPQDPLIFDDLSVMENVLFPFSEKDEGKAKRILESLGLGQLLNQDIRTLSTGERQRLSFARVPYEEKPILLLDECTSDLDQESTEILLDTIKMLGNDHLVFLAMHDPLVKEEIKDCSLLDLWDGQIDLHSNLSSSSMEKAVPIKSRTLLSSFRKGIRLSRPFPLVLFLLFAFLTSFSLLFHSFAVSFTAESNQKRIFHTYLQTAQAIALRDRDVSLSPEEGTSFTLSSSGPFVLSEEEGIGNRIVATLQARDFTFFADRLVSGRLPEKEGEVLVSSALVSFLCPGEDLSKALGIDLLSAILNYPSHDIIVGVFQAEESGEYSVRKNLTAERGAPAEYLVSYAFFSEVAFCYGEDEVNPQFLIATEENRRLLKGEDVVDFSLYQEAEEGMPYCPIEIDEQGQNPLDNPLFRSTGSSLSFSLLALSLSFLSALLCPFLFALSRKRTVLFLRVCGRSHNVLNQELLLALLVPGAFGIAFGFVLGYSCLGLLQAIYSSLLSSPSTIFLAPVLSSLLSVAVLPVFALVTLFFVCRRLSPKDLSHLLFEIKRK